jgi:hypothetical protein
MAQISIAFSFSLNLMYGKSKSKNPFKALKPKIDLEPT